MITFSDTPTSERRDMITIRGDTKESRLGWSSGRLIKQSRSSPALGGNRNGNAFNNSHVYRCDHIHVLSETLHLNPAFQGSDQSIDHYPKPDPK